MRQRELETLLVDAASRSSSGARDRLERRRPARGSCTAKLHARPYTADAPAPGGSPYAAFEDIFRGPEERVRELLEPYVELLRGHEPVLDLGCGRGELLELLSRGGHRGERRGFR